VKDATSQGVVDAIGEVATGSQDRPATPISIKSITVTE
jgi:hypothetical protein